MGSKTATDSARIWAKNEIITVQTRFVLPTPSTNVCSNITPRCSNFFGRALPAARPPNFYFIARMDPLPADSLPVLARAGAATAADLFRLSNQSCQNSKIGLAMNAHEYDPMI